MYELKQVTEPHRNEKKIILYKKINFINPLLPKRLLESACFFHVCTSLLCGVHPYEKHALINKRSRYKFQKSLSSKIGLLLLYTPS